MGSRRRFFRYHFAIFCFFRSGQSFSYTCVTSCVEIASTRQQRSSRMRILHFLFLDEGMSCRYSPGCCRACSGYQGMYSAYRASCRHPSWSSCSKAIALTCIHNDTDYLALLIPLIRCHGECCFHENTFALPFSELADSRNACEINEGEGDCDRSVSHTHPEQKQLT